MSSIVNQNYPNGLNPLGYLGVNAATPAQQVIQAPQAPTSANSQNFALGTQWLVPQQGATPAQIWELVALAGGVATWVQLYPGGGGGGGATTFPADSGTANEAGGILNILGDGVNINTVGSGDTITVNLDSHITVDAITDTSLGEGVVLSDSGGTLSSSNGLSGQVLKANGAGMAPTWEDESASGAITGLTADNAVTALPVAGIVHISGGIGINTDAAGNVVTINLDSPVSIANGGTNATSMTNTDGVVYYNGTRLVTTTVGTVGQVLTSNGAGMAPTFQPGGGGGGGITTLTANTGVAATASSIKLQGNNVIATNGASTSEIDFSLTNGTNGQVLIGGGAAPAWASITAGTNITLTPGANSLTIASTGSAPAAGCAFFYYQATRASNVLGTQTFYGLGATVVMMSLYDNTGGAVTPGNGAGTPMQFTAPATGLYFLSITANTQATTGSTQPSVAIAVTGNVATANNYFFYSNQPNISSANIVPVTMGFMVYMTLNDVAVFNVTRYTNGSLNAHVNGVATFSPYAAGQSTWVSGYRVA